MFPLAITNYVQRIGTDTTIACSLSAAFDNLNSHRGIALGNGGSCRKMLRRMVVLYGGGAAVRTPYSVRCRTSNVQCTSYINVHKLYVIHCSTYMINSYSLNSITYSVFDNFSYNIYCTQGL